MPVPNRPKAGAAGQRIADGDDRVQERIGRRQVGARAEKADAEPQ
jgi:hypothetical protein